ncbi:class I SAM-dependent methyltransferase [Salinicoccus hispanicus]|uniref:Methyltransferase domain-containing protein n=1 Tax=Salinicoccus hispanicus TaxID=157225 RepID=A0A6N8U208_9STAP|nr:class I SAM-dependent methyltransferase [Salinicoccus hispanicus]MXQ52104.1 methyltransferase domain-containing protein [Salinicoccus hispanicus]
MNVNFGNVAEEYLKFRDDIPENLPKELEKRGVEITGSKVADLGAGPGLLSKILSDKGAIVDAIEPSSQLIEVGKEHIGSDQRINFTQNYAENTGLPSNSYDIVIVMRAWHWFDREATIEEVKRILKPGGRLIIIDSGFTSASRIVKESMKIIQSYSPDKQIRAAGTKELASQMINSFPVEWFDEWKHARFDLMDLYKMDYDVRFTNEEWVGRLASVSWIAAFKEKQRTSTLNKISTYLEEHFPDGRHKIPHILSVAILKNKNNLPL